MADFLCYTKDMEITRHVPVAKLEAAMNDIVASVEDNELIRPQFFAELSDDNAELLGRLLIEWSRR